MKISGQKMEVTVPIYGQERTFSEEELIAILEKYFSTESAETQPEAEVIRAPVEDEWFEVDPLTINPKLFSKERKDLTQERIRLLILEAFIEVRNNPKKYGRKFEAMIPKKTWFEKRVSELKEMAETLGDHNANWVEQALVWAQRICNGESWKNLCEDTDTASYFRMVIWKNSKARYIGGSTSIKAEFPPCYIGAGDCDSESLLAATVPLVIRYK